MDLIIAQDMLAPVIYQAMMAPGEFNCIANLWWLKKIAYLHDIYDGQINICQQHPLKWSTGRRILQSRMTTTHQGMVMTSQFTHFLLADTSGKVTN